MLNGRLNLVHLKLGCLSKKLITVWAVWFQQRSFNPKSGGLSVFKYPFCNVLGY